MRPSNYGVVAAEPHSSELHSSELHSSVKQLEMVGSHQERSRSSGEAPADRLVLIVAFRRLLASTYSNAVRMNNKARSC